MKYQRALIVLTLLCLASVLLGQTNQDTIFTPRVTRTMQMDAKATESVWQEAQWTAIDQVWMPFATVMKEGDFAGRFKVAWDKNHLYMLVEVEDDVLSDDHPDPLKSWWDDDCLEVFIDEDRSMGWHENDENAFAYHLSIYGDAIDKDKNGGVNYKDHITMDLDPLGNNRYIWEVAFKIYGDSYDPEKPKASRIALKKGKVMGLSVAYCDNDETNGRENFIGSMIMPESNWDDSYKNADFFGVIKLVDPKGRRSKK